MDESGTYIASRNRGATFSHKEGDCRMNEERPDLRYEKAVEEETGLRPYHLDQPHLNDLITTGRTGGLLIIASNMQHGCAIVFPAAPRAESLVKCGQTQNHQ